MTTLLDLRVGPDLAAFLERLERQLAAQAGGQSEFLSRLTRYIFDSSGKRLRPALVYLSAGFGDADERETMETALAVEMIHASTLVHDDLVDEALLRRAKPTVGVRFGEGAAVLLGDHVYALAFQRLAALGRPALISAFANATAEMCEGEIGQYEKRHTFDLSEGEYIEFLRKKTASLMSAAAWAGGFLAGLPPRNLEALRTFGDRIGVAFQIVDDVLDVAGDESIVGKTLRTDLRNGKMTLPLIRFARTLSESDRSAFRETLRTQAADLDGWIVRLLDSGVIADCRAAAGRLARDAEEVLRNLPDLPPRRLLLEVAHRLTDRTG
jgi:geranylgeranyl pyrophosphate synthase